MSSFISVYISVPAYFNKKDSVCTDLDSPLSVIEEHWRDSYLVDNVDCIRKIQLLKLVSKCSMKEDLFSNEGRRGAQVTFLF